MQLLNLFFWLSLAVVLIGCAAAAIECGEVVAEEVIEHEVVPVLEKAADKQIEKEFQKRS